VTDRIAELRDMRDTATWREQIKLFLLTLIVSLAATFICSAYVALNLLTLSATCNLLMVVLGGHYTLMTIAKRLPLLARSWSAIDAAWHSGSLAGMAIYTLAACLP